MKILALETASEICGVALTEDKDLVAEYRLVQKNVHNEKLVSAINLVVSDANCDLETLDGIAVSMGPGSFTGLRIGISVAKGLAFTLGIPLVGVNTLDALAHQANFWEGQICSIIKAREQEVYFALYNRNSERVQRCSDYQIKKTEELEDFFTVKTLVISNSVSLNSIVSNEKVVLAPKETAILSPFTVAQLGYQKFQNNDVEVLDSVEPFYLKDFIPKRKDYYGVRQSNR
jgi:tRNA threonylcarbamoyladenosine biosynthesis protein TsaB